MKPITGGCQCGAVRYVLACDDAQVYACHCLECQKQTSSAFALSVPLVAHHLVVEGELIAYKRPTESGTHTNCWFCSGCGTRIYHQSERSPDVVTLKGGTLDDTAKLAPVAHLWVKRKQPWFELPKDAVVFETQPADLKAWRSKLLPARA